MNLSLPFLFLLWAFGSKGARRPAPAPAPRSPSLPSGATSTRASTSTPPWPQVVPPGLPPFPGTGWEPDEPPPAIVQARAGALLKPLWTSGAGTFRIEQTGGRWIAYRATAMGSKRGVVAYRVRPGSPAASSTRQTQASTRAAPRPPAARPARPAARPAASPRTPPRVAPIPTATTHRTPTGTVQSKSWLEMPTLRRGAGMKPRPPNPNVKVLQARLSITADGRFGPGTERAVKAFQGSKRLVQDGIVGPKTWGALFGTRT